VFPNNRRIVIVIGILKNDAKFAVCDESFSKYSFVPKLRNRKR
jgi:hypothetical protein